VYDPLVGRMMSADPMVPDPLNGQAWNRYSYVINNPLAFTDPNGYCFLNLCNLGHEISTFFDRTFGVLFRDVPILGTLFEIAAVGLCTVLSGGGATPVCAAAAFGSTTFVTGVTSGNLGYALRAGLIAGVTALAFYEVGDITTHNPAFGTPQYFENVAGHALVGCASAEVSGGKCGPAALAGGITSAAGPFINGHGIASLVENSVLGGLASVAGGGKFANGAITGAFGYLFNACGANPRGCIANSSGILTGARGTLQSAVDLVEVAVSSTGNSDLIARFDQWQLSISGDSSAALRDWGIRRVTNDGNATQFASDIGSLSEDEKVFVVAHEWAHTLPQVYNVPSDTPGVFDLTYGVSAIERAADAFARTLLGLTANPGRFSTRP
jgi:hypothetical protein